MQAVRTVQKRLASEAYDIYSDETMVSHLSLLTRPYISYTDSLHTRPCPPRDRSMARRAGSTDLAYHTRGHTGHVAEGESRSVDDTVVKLRSLTRQTNMAINDSCSRTPVICPFGRLTFGSSPISCQTRCQTMRAGRTERKPRSDTPSAPARLKVTLRSGADLYGHLCVHSLGSPPRNQRWISRPCSALAIARPSAWCPS